MSKGALIVGIDDYTIQNPLSGCISDAKKIDKLLKRNGDKDKTLNFSTTLLTSDKKSKVSSRNILKEAKELFSRECEIALFYFSGHGYSDEMGSFLITPDLENHYSGIEMQQIINLAKNSKAREVMIILDCCYSGYAAIIPMLGENLTIIKEGMSIITASRKNEFAIEEEGKGGVFTSLFCEALEGGAADILGDVTIAGAYNYVDKLLGFFAQRPQFKSSVSTYKTIRKCKSDLELSEFHEIVNLFDDKDEKFKLDKSYEPHFGGNEVEKHRKYRILQKYAKLRIIAPRVPEEAKKQNDLVDDFTYHAAEFGGYCELTPTGKFYWQLVKKGLI